MLITAKFNSTCPKCGQYINVGTQVNWEKGQKATHAKCPNTKPTVKTASETETPTTGKGNNRKPGYCDSCGAYLKVGEGKLWKCLGSSSNCFKHWDNDEEGGWHLNCLDETSCKTRREEQKVQREKEAQERKIRAEEKKRQEEETAKVTKALFQEATKDLVKVNVEVPGIVPGGVIYEDKTGWFHVTLTRATLPDGRAAVLESAIGSDDYRHYTYVPRDVAETSLDAWIKKVNITPEAAQEWLQKYTGCEGTEIYLRAAGLDPWPQPANPHTP